MFARTTLLTAVAMIAAWGAGVAAGQEAATSAPAGQALDPEVDRILTRLEERQVHDLRAKLSWKRTYLIEEDEDASVKLGTIWYKEADPVAVFRVHFDESVFGRRKQKIDEQHLFDGLWYVELQSQTKSVTRREIRKADDKRNPYKLGEGPFPLPFGQTKADILREFEVELVSAAEGDPEDATHLLLTPRPGTQTGERYKRVEFWVLKSGPLNGLPIKVVAGKTDGTGKVNSLLEITFSDVELNAGLSSALFRIQTPPGFDETVEPLEEAGVGGTAKGE